MFQSSCFTRLYSGIVQSAEPPALNRAVKVQILLPGLLARDRRWPVRLLHQEVLMDQQIVNSFEKIGARVRVTLARENSVMGRRVPFTINIRRDRNGNYFDLLQREDANVEVLETRSWDRHLLLS